MDDKIFEYAPEKLNVSNEHISAFIQYFDMFSSIATESFYVLDILQKQFCYVKPDDLFLCGFSVEDVLRQGYDFYSKIVYPGDLALWTDMRRVVLLTNERYKQKEVKDFISKLREKYMGDIIDTALSNGKPVQLLPFYNFPDKHEIYKKHNFSSFGNVLKNLSKISIHIDSTTNIVKLIPFLNSIPGTPLFNIVGNVSEAEQYDKLLSFLNEHPSPKDISCSYLNVIPLQPTFENNFSFQILVKLPIDMKQWNHSMQLLLNQTLPVEYVFDVTSLEDCQHMEQLVEQYQIEKYCHNPVYTGHNIGFFEENVFLTKEDILSTSMSIKDFFFKQNMNTHDFGKINIMPNGDAYANVNHPALGNIYTHSIFEIVRKEVNEGKSWFRIRNQAPCNTCVYQWLCPSPSDYEIAIGRPNLCHVKK